MEPRPTGGPARASALDDLSRRFRPALVSFFLRRVGNAAEAEDLAHEVLLRLTGTPIEQLRSAEAYVFQTAANLLCDRARRSRVHNAYIASLPASAESPVDPIDPARIDAGRRSLESIVTRLSELPQRAREIFVLYRIENVPKREIADAYKVSISTVEKDVAKATAYLMLFREEDE